MFQQFTVSERSTLQFRFEALPRQMQVPVKLKLYE